MAAYRRVYDSSHVTCRLTANNRDQLWQGSAIAKTLGNKVWATVTFLPGKGQFFLGGGISRRIINYRDSLQSAADKWLTQIAQTFAAEKRFSFERCQH